MAERMGRSGGANPARDRLPVRPENLSEFRLGQLVLLLSVAEQKASVHPLDVERIGYYDFFSANPFLVFDSDQEQRRELVLAGLDSKSLSYQSSAQRFSNRRARLQHDIALLVAYGLMHARVHAKSVSYKLTDEGREFACKFGSLYARAYRKSADLVVHHLSRFSDTKIRNEATRWLKAAAFMIDLFDIEEAP